MRLVLSERLWVGNSGDAGNVTELAELGITAIVALAGGERPLSPPRDWIYCRIPLHDGEGNSPLSLRLAVEVVASLLDARIKTLVACSAGMSRSVAIAAAAIAKSRDESPDFHLSCVAGAGPADVSPRLWQDILFACFGDGARQSE